jgi:hypothetical protein
VFIFPAEIKTILKKFPRYFKIHVTRDSSPAIRLGLVNSIGELKEETEAEAKAQGKGKRGKDKGQGIRDKL